MLLHIHPTRQRGKRTGSLARASGWYMTFFAAGVIANSCSDNALRRKSVGFGEKCHKSPGIVGWMVAQCFIPCLSLLGNTP